MEIFLLTNKSCTAHGETRAMVVVAPVELAARELAAKTSHSHNTCDRSNGHGDEGSQVWLNPTNSSCEQIGVAAPGLPIGVLITDFVYD